MKKSVIGIIAHVDAGKTTLSESMLYLSGAIRKQGRVDKGDTHFDTATLERERGITIFTGGSRCSWKNARFTLLDTPGHADFSAEAERTINVIDSAILVISGTDGVQAHTRTLLRLLERCNVPTFIFVTKMDISYLQEEDILTSLKECIHYGIVPFTPQPDGEALAECSEALLEEYLSGEFTDESISSAIASRRCFPVLFGSGLKGNGVETLLDILERYSPSAKAKAEFGAKVFKLHNDSKQGRLTFMRITGGELHTMDMVNGEKVTRIRLLSPGGYEDVQEVSYGDICAVSGLSAKPGTGLGCEPECPFPMLQPVMSCTIELPRGTDPVQALSKLRALEDEDPLLHLEWNRRAGKICIRIMGDIQTEVLTSIIYDRFGMEVSFGAPEVVYRETIKKKVEGVGHFEPLRHYAEVHLLLEPGEEGSGVRVCSDCSSDDLAIQWQSAVMSALSFQEHPGVLTGSPLTDIKITLLSGRSHPKHTEGGDFREAALRALRQGLMKSECTLLEPKFSFTLVLPPSQSGRAISDIRKMGGTCQNPDTIGDSQILRGTAPAKALHGYASEVSSYTHGLGRLSLIPSGFMPCTNAEEIISSIGYEAESDLDNPASSVFCSHGSGTVIPWDKVEEHMHLPSVLEPEKKRDEIKLIRQISIDEKELRAILEREFGPGYFRERSYTKSKTVTENSYKSALNYEPVNRYYIVDGYNVIYAWPELSPLMDKSPEAAREKLKDMLSSFASFTGCELVLVFDAYKVPGGAGSREDFNGIHIAHTAAGETADAYIEKLCSSIGRNYSVTVVTNDNLIRLSGLRAGVMRMSSAEFHTRVSDTMDRISELVDKSSAKAHIYNPNLNIDA